ncbi:hypothetical protein GCM10027184_69770 [Saccharothrix stipae]
MLLAVLVVMVGVTYRARATEGQGGGRASAWNVPGANPHFTGRAVDLARVNRLLRKRSRVAVHTIRGMGGVGKTQLAMEYCHRNSRRYDVVWWVSADVPALIPDQLRSLGRAMGMSLPEDTDEAVQSLLSHLRTLRRWLLVFDNAEAATDLHPYLPSDSGHVLVTTQRGGFDAIGGVIELDTLSRRESTGLLARRAPSLSRAQADELAELLGDLPLGLEQAAAYITRSHIPPDEYLNLLRTSPDRVVDKGEDGQRRTADRSLDKLWTVSLDHLDRHHPAAAQLLALCAYLAPDAIPLNLVAFDATLLPAPLNAAVSDSAALSHVVGALTDYSLLKRDDGDLVVHRLLQLAVQNRTARTDAGHDHLLRHVAALLRGALPADLMREPRAWPIWRELLPHVLTVLHHEHRLHVLAPERTSWLLYQTAVYFRATGRPLEAQPLLDRAVAIDEAAHSPDHPDLVPGLNHLSRNLRTLGRSTEAHSVLKRALTIIEKAHGHDHPDVAVVASELGMVLSDLGHHADARAHLERALAITETLHEDDHPDVAACATNLATVLQDLGHLPEARHLHERALRISEAARGEDHPDVAACAGNLALVLQGLGHSEEALPLLERALRIDEATYGPDHPAVAVALGNLAAVMRDLERAPEARPLIERALRINEAAYGSEHPAVSRDLNTLGLVMRDIGRLDEALSLITRALGMSEKLRGPEHSEVATRLNNLGRVLRDLGRPGEAVRPLRRAIAIDQANYGPEHPSLRPTWKNLVLVLRDLGRVQEAEAAQQHVRRIDEIHSPPSE